MGNDQSKGNTSRQPFLPNNDRNGQPPFRPTSQPHQNLQSQPQLLQQTPTMSPEEVRKKRLERMEKKNIIPQKGMPLDFTNHPIAKEYGNQAYLIHMLFEDIFKNTFHKSSLQRNPGLKLLQTHEKKKEILLYTIENFENIIPDILESDLFYSNEEKLTFLIEVSQRLKSTDQLGLLSDTKKSEFQKMTLSFLTNYLQAPQIFSPEIIQEDLNNYSDCSCTLLDLFYRKMIQFQDNEFLNDFFLNLEENELYTIVTQLLKRIRKNCLEVSIEDTNKATMALGFLATLLSQGERMIDFFVNHDLYLPKDLSKTGLDIQKDTIFGACLSLTTLVEESNSAKAYLSDPQKWTNLSKILPEVRAKIHSLIDDTHRIMELIIKSNPKYKKNILNWLYYVLNSNNAKQRGAPGNAVSTHGWFTNYLVLLLKFCQKLLEDPSSYPNWLSKIDLTYLQEKSIFEKIHLLNGTKNTVLNQQEATSLPDGNDQKPKFSFLTELFFITTHAILLHKTAFKDFTTFAQQISLDVMKIKDNPTLLGASNFTRYAGYCIQFQDPFLCSYIFKLLAFQTLLILHSYEIPIKSLEMVHGLFEQMEALKLEYFELKPSLPVYWVEIISDYLYSLALTKIVTLYESRKCFEILMNLLLCVLKNRHWINLSHIKFGCASFFKTFRAMKLANTQTEEKLHFVFKQNPYYEKYIVSALIESFVEAEEFGSSQYAINEKLNFRYPLCTLLQHLLTVIFPNDKFSYAVKGLDRLIYSSNDLYKKFVFSYFDDITFLLDVCFSKLRELHHLGESSMNPSIFTYAAKLQATLEENEITNLLAILTEYCALGSTICQVFPDFFLNKEVQDKFTSCLNHSIKVLSSLDILKMDLPNFKLLKCSPEFIIQSVLQIFVNLANHEEFIKNFVLDKNFHLEDFYGIVKITETHNLLNGEKTATIVQLISKLEKLAA